MIPTDFLALQPQPFGLDISDLSFKIAKLEKHRGSFCLIAVERVPIGPGIVSAGEIKDIKVLSALINNAVYKKLGAGSKYVVCSLPEEKGFLRVIQMPKLDPRELKKAVYFEAENYIPLPIDEVYLGYETVKSSKDQVNHSDVLIVAFPKKVVDSYVACLKEAGLTPVAFELESLAVSRVLIKNGVSFGPILILDVGEVRTGFMVFSGFSLMFTASISIASNKFSEAIARVKNIKIGEAEELKIKYGLLGRRSREGREVFDALVPPLTDLTEQVKKYLDYYKTHTVHEHVDGGKKSAIKVYLCGGGAALRGLSSYLTSELKLAVELGNPWVNILAEPLKEVPELSYRDSLGYATALGLAMRETKH